MISLPDFRKRRLTRRPPDAAMRNASATSQPDQGVGQSYVGDQKIDFFGIVKRARARQRP